MRQSVIFWLFHLIYHVTSANQWLLESEEYTMAVVNISYRDPVTLQIHFESAEMAKFGTGRIGPASGILVHVRSANGTSHTGCDPRYENLIPPAPWIALVRRGRCNFDDKLQAAYLNNASGLIVYNNKDDGLQRMTLRNKHREEMVAVFISRAKGEQLSVIADNDTLVTVHIDVGTHYAYRLTNINRTSVMFVSVSFIILMLISLAWLVFYYVQRFRHLHAKEQLSKQLTNAAKRVVAKIPTKSIKSNDKEITEAECCAICIEPYKSSEVIRVLPCKHEFHKTCIDPWLLEHRTCPMCKLNILKHYGCVFASQESIVNVGMEVPIMDTSMALPRIQIQSRRTANEESARMSSPIGTVGEVSSSEESAHEHRGGSRSSSHGSIRLS